MAEGGDSMSTVSDTWKDLVGLAYQISKQQWVEPSTLVNSDLPIDEAGWVGPGSRWGSNAQLQPLLVAEPQGFAWTGPTGQPSIIPLVSGEDYLIVRPKTVRPDGTSYGSALIIDNAGKVSRSLSGTVSSSVITPNEYEVGILINSISIKGERQPFSITQLTDRARPRHDVYCTWEPGRVRSGGVYLEVTGIEREMTDVDRLVSPVRYLIDIYIPLPVGGADEILPDLDPASVPSVSTDEVELGYWRPYEGEIKYHSFPWAYEIAGRIQQAILPITGDIPWSVEYFAIQSLGPDPVPVLKSNIVIQSNIGGI